MLLIGVLLIFAVFGFWGWQKGIVRLLLSVASIIITILAGLLIAPVATTAIKNSTELDEKMSDQVYEVLLNNQDINNIFGESFNVSIPYNEEQLSTYKSTIQESISEIGSKLKLPESLVENISNISDTKLSDDSATATDVTLKELTLRVFADRITNIALTAIIYIIVMLVVFIALKVIIVSTGIITRLPVIRQANQIGGLCIGLLEGLMVVWIFFTLLTAMSNTEFASTCLGQIGDNSFLSFLYNNNLITKIMFSTIK